MKNISVINEFGVDITSMVRIVNYETSFKVFDEFDNDISSIVKII